LKHLVNHLVAEHFPEIVGQSYLNCHAQGLHSIMFLDTPEHRVRLFVTTPDHTLYKNTGNPKQKLSLAAHPHHCNLTIEVIKGIFHNITYEPKEGGELKPFYYISGIHNAQGGFVARHDRPGATFVGSTHVQPGESLVLPAHALHSVLVPKGQVAAWFVYEGREDNNYLSYSYANHDLEQFSFDGLYQRPTAAQVMELLQSAGIFPRPVPSPLFPKVDDTPRFATVFTKF
jgi:hypothetical protein